MNRIGKENFSKGCEEKEGTEFSYVETNKSRSFNINKHYCELNLY